MPMPDGQTDPRGAGADRAAAPVAPCGRDCASCERRHACAAFATDLVRARAGD